VKTLVDKHLKAGDFVVDWDGKDQRGVEVSSGVYFYRVMAGDFSDVRKMILLK
jgi:flagellar hook assembly protein FlgD